MTTTSGLDKFIERLLAIYPEYLRPDGENMKEIRRFVKKQKLSDKIGESALDIVQENFSRFPTIADLSYAIHAARNKAFREKPWDIGMEYFEIDGNRYARPVKIVPQTGEVIKQPLPNGAENYFLWLPPEMQANQQYITAKEAYEQGAISSEFYSQLERMRSSQTPRLNRFQRIMQQIREEREEKNLKWSDI